MSNPHARLPTNSSGEYDVRLTATTTAKTRAGTAATKRTILRLGACVIILSPSFTHRGKVLPAANHRVFGPLLPVWVRPVHPNRARDHRTTDHEESRVKVGNR